MGKGWIDIITPGWHCVVGNEKLALWKWSVSIWGWRKRFWREVQKIDWYNWCPLEEPWYLDLPGSFLNLCCSKSGLGARSVNITWDLMVNEESQAFPGPRVQNLLFNKILLRTLCILHLWGTDLNFINCYFYQRASTPWVEERSAVWERKESDVGDQDLLLSLETLSWSFLHSTRCFCFLIRKVRFWTSKPLRSLPGSDLSKCWICYVSKRS